MRDKLSEVFSPQAIKNVINFLEDILKNNNDNEINSVCNIIHEFDEINSISVVHFLDNFLMLVSKSSSGLYAKHKL